MLTVLRIGHRRERDHRISTHCGLVARAFGAQEIVYTGERDDAMAGSVSDVAKEWGGNFGVSYSGGWKEAVKGRKVAHLTMYGLPLQDVIGEIRREKDIVVAVGGEKVPSEMYDEAAWNVAVTSQPHSEIAALAVFLDRYFEGKEMCAKFANASKSVEPMARGKKVLKAKPL